jgi:competence protein ComEC
MKDLKDLNLSSDAKIKIFWPDAEVFQDPDIDDNGKSAVSLIEFAGRKVLLCSDIERFAQAELFRIYPILKADVVVVPHHGSRRTSDQHFLENLDGILICSCRPRRYERPQGIELVGEANTLYTSRDGAVIIYVDKDSGIRLTSRRQ